MLIRIVKMAALRWVACQWVFSPNVTALQRNTCKLACVVQIEMFFCFLLHLVIAHIIYVLKRDDLYLCMFFVLGTSKDKHQKHNDIVIIIVYIVLRSYWIILRQPRFIFIFLNSITKIWSHSSCTCTLCIHLS